MKNLIITRSRLVKTIKSCPKPKSGGQSNIKIIFFIKNFCFGYFFLFKITKITPNIVKREVKVKVDHQKLGPVKLKNQVMSKPKAIKMIPPIISFFQTK